jgi:hypothetical protein
MITTTSRVDVKLTSSLLMVQLMEGNGWKVREFADAVDGDLRKRFTKAAKQGVPRPTCGRSTIGHLRSGYRMTCHEEVAQSIANILRLPRAALFTDHVSKVQTETRPTYARKMTR